MIQKVENKITTESRSRIFLGLLLQPDPPVIYPRKYDRKGVGGGEGRGITHVVSYFFNEADFSALSKK